MQAPLVSVVTPCLNPGERLVRCLASVAAQTHPAVEHIVVDGGSTDGSVELLGGTPGITWMSEPDGGQAAAINKGFGLASGSILTWLNADDVLLPGTVTEAVRVLREQPGLGLVYGNCRIVQEGRELLVWRAPRRLTLSGLETGWSIPQPGAFFTRSALDRAGWLDESYELAMDVDLWLRLLSAGVESQSLRRVVSIFEVHERSKTGSVPRRRFYEENARAFLTAGRTSAAAHSLGQAAAASSAEDGRVDPARLAVEVSAAEHVAREWPVPPPPRAIRAAAAAEAAVLELHASPRGLRHLLVRDVWLDGAARSRLAHAVRRAGPRLARQALRRP